MRFFIIISILTILNSYVYLKSIQYFSLSNNYNLITVWIIISLVIFQSLGLIAQSRSLRKITQKLKLNNLALSIFQNSYLMLGVVQCLFFYNLLADIIKIILRISLSTNSYLYIYFTNYNIPVIFAITLITVVLGIITVIKGPFVEKVEILLKNLPVSFNGFTIAQISDLHVGATIKYNYVRKVVSLTNDLKPNLIALTGDFVDGSVDDLKDDVAPLADLKSTHGKFFVTGNHEYYAGVDEWLQKFTSLGMHNLSNEHVLIKNNHEQIILAGVTDYSTIRKRTKDISSPSKALIGAPANLVKILLAHQPASYINAYKAGVDLQLSGHTHSGQFFPFTMLIRFFHRYYRGLNQHENMWIYINRGTGYWGPPLRFGAPAEITLITLRKIP